MARDGVILEVASVSKSFGALAALSNVSLAVRAGEVFSVIGPNGAGKSTLFNVVSGLHVPTTGHVRFQGQEIGGLARYICHDSASFMTGTDILMDGGWTAQ